MDYYDGDIKDDAEGKLVGMENGVESEENELENELGVLGDEAEVEDEEVDDINYDDYPYGWPLDWSYITDVSLRLGPRYDKHGREIPKLGSFHNLELGSLTPYIEEEDDIDARLATLDRKLMIHSFKNLTLENIEDENERMGRNESEYLP